MLTDAAGYVGWNPAVVSIEGPIAEGKTIRLVSVASPKRTFKLTVAAMEPPSRMVWSDGMPLGLFKGERTFRLIDRDCRLMSAEAERVLSERPLALVAR